MNDPLYSAIREPIPVAKMRGGGMAGRGDTNQTEEMPLGQGLGRTHDQVGHIPYDSKDGE